MKESVLLRFLFRLCTKIRVALGNKVEADSKRLRNTQNRFIY